MAQQAKPFHIRTSANEPEVSPKIDFGSGGLRSK